jgi:type I restriction enzyme M protein
MIGADHQKLADFIWNIANKLRGPYRRPQYRKIMLPLIVLRRLDCVLEPTKDKVLEQYGVLKKKGLSEAAIEKTLAKVASKDRQQPVYNVSRFTFPKLLGDPEGIAKNLAVCTNQPSRCHCADFMRHCRCTDSSVRCSISKFRQLGLWVGLEL